MKEREVNLRILKDNISHDVAISGGMIFAVFETVSPLAKDSTGSQVLDTVGKIGLFGTAAILTGREIYLRKKEKGE